MTKKKKKKNKISGDAAKPRAAAPSAGAEAAARVKLEEKIERLEQKLEDKREKVAAKAREGFASTPDVEDSSIPPVVEDEFFAKGDEPPRVSAGLSGSFDAVVPDPRSQRKLSPEAQKRRADLAKYVKAAVVISAAILAIGFLRVKFMSGAKEQAHPPAAAAEQAARPEQQAAPVATEAAKDEHAAAKDEPKEEAKPVEAKAEAKPEETKPEAKPEQEKKQPPKLTAAQEKAQAQAALDRNNAGFAVAAAERSVALDPTDAEAWLILGAAYQMQNRNAEARRAFGSCAKQAKRGPVGECTQMLAQ